MATLNNMKELNSRLAKHGIASQLNISDATKSATKSDQIRTPVTPASNDSITQINPTSRPLGLPYELRDQIWRELHDSITPVKQTSRLLDLPSELRDQIWREVLISSTGFIKPLRSGNRSRSTIQLDFHAAAPPKHKNHWLYGSQIKLSLLYTTRRIYHECAFVFWTMNTFVLDLNDSFFVPSLLEEKKLSTSFCGKIKHVHLDIDIIRNGLPAAEILEKNKTLQSGLDILQKMADNGSLKSLTIKQVSDIHYLEDYFSTNRLSPIPFDELIEILTIFARMNEGGSLEKAGVKRRVEIQLGWDQLSDKQQQRWNCDYCSAAQILLTSLAQYAGGDNSEMWVDGKLYIESIDGEMEVHGDPFLMKDLEDLEEEE